MVRLGPIGFAALLGLASPLAAYAQEPRGCDKFKWPVGPMQAAMASPGLPVIRSGETRAVSPAALVLSLGADARLPKPPERASKPGTFAGYLAFAAPAKGAYQVTLSDAAWIDVVQGEAYREPASFSGALDCPNVRKVVRLDLDGLPFRLQVSGAPADTIRVIVEPVP